MSLSSSSSAPTLHQPATLEQAKQLGLLDSEYDTICQTLGRQPNFTEVSAYAVMWAMVAMGCIGIVFPRRLVVSFHVRMGSKEYGMSLCKS